MGDTLFPETGLLQMRTSRHRWGVDWRLVYEHAYAAHCSRWQG